MPLGEADHQSPFRPNDLRWPLLSLEGPRDPIRWFAMKSANHASCLQKVPGQHEVIHVLPLPPSRLSHPGAVLGLASERPRPQRMCFEISMPRLLNIFPKSLFRSSCQLWLTDTL